MKHEESEMMPIAQAHSQHNGTNTTEWIVEDNMNTTT